MRLRVKLVGVVWFAYICFRSVANVLNLGWGTLDISRLGA